MHFVMRSDATDRDVGDVVARLEAIGAEPRVSSGRSRVVIGAEVLSPSDLADLAAIEKVVDGPVRLVERQIEDEPTLIRVGSVTIGDGSLTMVAGPCAVESRDQLFASAEAVQAAGAQILRGDAFKPRTSPYSFQGLGEAGLELLAEARETFGMPFVAEVIDPRDVALVAEYADIIRIGSRNMSNFPLLREVGRTRRPVQLKRGFTATVDEWLDAAEYIYAEGNHEVILVERGIRTFENAARNTLDITAVPVVQRRSHLPVFVDPSHAAGKRELVAPLALAAVAAGADGLMIDVHPAPDEALVDGAQALLPEEFADLMHRIRAVAAALAEA